MSTSSIWQQNIAQSTLDLAKDPKAVASFLPLRLRDRLGKFMQRNNVIAQRERPGDRSNRESINDFLGKLAGLGTLGAGVVTGSVLPLSVVLALWANNAYRHGSNAISNFEKERAGKLQTNLEVFEKLTKISRPLTSDESDQYHSAVEEINKLSNLNRSRYIYNNLVNVFPLSASFNALALNALATYKNMTPKAKFNPGAKRLDITKIPRIVGVGLAGTTYKSVSGIAKSIGEVVHSAYAAIKPIPKIADWEKVKFAKIKDPSAAWVAEKLDGFMKGKWFTKARDAMTKLSQWPPLRETAKA